MRTLVCLLLVALLAACGGGEQPSAAPEPAPWSQALETTGRSLDIAVVGEGLFVLQAQSTGVRTYSRLGRLDLDSQGQLIHSDGALVLGVPSSSDRDAEPMPAAPWAIPARGTSTVLIEANLDNRRPVVVGTRFDPADAATYCCATALTVYTPTARTLLLYFVRIDASIWQVHAVMDAQLASASLQIEFAAEGSLAASSPKLLRLPAGELGITTAINIDLTSLSLFGYPFAVFGLSQDGYAAGTLVRGTVDSDGVLKLVYDNGQTAPGGQLVLARFSVADRLHRVGGSSWVCAEGCAAPRLGTPGSALLGQTQSGVLSTLY